jgi:hypothetical protein
MYCMSAEDAVVCCLLLRNRTNFGPVFQGVGLIELVGERVVEYHDYGSLGWQSCCIFYSCPRRIGGPRLRACQAWLPSKCGTGRLGTCYYAYSCLYIPAWERPQRPPLAGRSAFVRSVGVSGCYCTKRRMATAMPAWESAYNTGPASRAGNGGDTTEAWFLVLSDGLLTLDFERVLGTRFMGGQFANYKAPFVFLLSAVASVIWRLFEPSLYGS